MTAAYGCCGQALTRFTGHPCTGPGRQPHRRSEQSYSPPLPRYTLGVNDPRRYPNDPPTRPRTLLLRVIRAAFLILFVTVTLLTILNREPISGKPGVALLQGWYITVGAALGLGIIVILVDVFTPQKKISTLFSIFLGLLAAMVATVAFNFVIDLLATAHDIDPTIMGAIKVLIGIVLSYLAITTVLQTQDDFRLVIPYVEFAKQIRGPRPYLLDTSSLIDARIVDVAETGLIQAPIIIPRFVIHELQALSDSRDKLKRARGRRGLEIITLLQHAAHLDVSIDESPVPGKAVDQMLVELARQMPATIVTTDVALRRVASIHDVPVLNINDLANALKPAVIPGEHLSVTLIKPGEQQGQGVGYLDDGTMVIAEDGADHIGEMVTLTVTSSLQTSAGRLIFGRIGPAEYAPSPPSPPFSQTPDPQEPDTKPGQGNTGATLPAEDARQSENQGESGATGESPQPRPGPFPSKPPNPRSSRARNPRR